MDNLSDRATVSDTDILREYECVEECDYGADRTTALAAELQKRQIDF